jgi:hypothetical protein
VIPGRFVADHVVIRGQDRATVRLFLVISMLYDVAGEKYNLWENLALFRELAVLEGHGQQAGTANCMGKTINNNMLTRYCNLR